MHDQGIVNPVEIFSIFFRESLQKMKNFRLDGKQRDVQPG